MMSKGISSPSLLRSGDENGQIKFTEFGPKNILRTPSDTLSSPEISTMKPITKRNDSSSLKSEQQNTIDFESKMFPKVTNNSLPSSGTTQKRKKNLSSLKSEHQHGTQKIIDFQPTMIPKGPSNLPSTIKSNPVPFKIGEGKEQQNQIGFNPMMMHPMHNMPPVHLRGTVCGPGPSRISNNSFMMRPPSSISTLGEINQLRMFAGPRPPMGPMIGMPPAEKTFFMPPPPPPGWGPGCPPFLHPLMFRPGVINFPGQGYQPPPPFMGFHSNMGPQKIQTIITPPIETTFIESASSISSEEEERELEILDALDKMDKQLLLEETADNDGVWEEINKPNDSKLLCKL